MEQLDPAAGEFLVTLFFVLCLIMNAITFTLWDTKGGLNVMMKIGHFFVCIGAVLALLHRFGIIRLYF
jgi:hypothetical protein